VDFVSLLAFFFPLVWRDVFLEILVLRIHVTRLRRLRSLGFVRSREFLVLIGFGHGFSSILLVSLFGLNPRPQRSGTVSWVLRG